jgi:hypothetical protein
MVFMFTRAYFDNIFFDGKIYYKHYKTVMFTFLFSKSRRVLTQIAAF